MCVHTPVLRKVIMQHDHLSEGVSAALTHPVSFVLPAVRAAAASWRRFFIDGGSPRRFRMEPASGLNASPALRNWMVQTRNTHTHSTTQGEHEIGQG